MFEYIIHFFMHSFMCIMHDIIVSPTANNRAWYWDNLHLRIGTNIITDWGLDVFWQIFGKICLFVFWRGFRIVGGGGVAKWRGKNCAKNFAPTLTNFEPRPPLKNIWPLFSQVLLIYVILPETRRSIGNILPNPFC